MPEFNFNILHKDLFPNRIADPVHDFRVRPTVRGVIFDENHNICIRSKKGSGFFFLPGGGIENTENPIEALKRECLEEIGCNITNIQKIGIIIEYKDETQEKRTNECFTADLSGQKSEPTLAIGDEEGFDVIWINIHEAVTLLEKQKDTITEDLVNFYSKTFNTVRDLGILKYLLP